jgi:hypothetical protein
MSVQGRDISRRGLTTIGLLMASITPDETTTALFLSRTTTPSVASSSGNPMSGAYLDGATHAATG